MLQPIMIVLFISAGLAAFGGVRAIGEPSSQTVQSVPVKESWQKEFEEICSNTQEAMKFSQEELASLVSRCDALQPQIEKLDETQKKLYLGRLRRCRAFYAYVLDSKRAVNEPGSSTAQSAPAQGAWQKEFDDICSKTQDAMTLSQQELESLISRCDALQPQIEKLDQTRKKVYLRRLQMCRGLYAYVLDSKRNENK